MSIFPVARTAMVIFPGYTGFCIVIALVFAAAVGSPASASAALPKRKQDAHAIAAQIRAVLKAQQDAWNRGDIDSFMNGYAGASRRSGSNSTTFVSEDKVTRGWQTVRDRYRKKYSDRAKMGKLTFSDLEITPLSSDSAVVLGRWKLRRASDQPHGRFTLIFRKVNDSWRIVHDHTSAAPPPKQ
jgi:ketosteroid isomerase-like protein